MKYFLGAVGVATLFIGGIGVMNVMLVAVRERTREIGVRKALGATRRSIVRQFFVETLIVVVRERGIGLGVAYGDLRPRQPAADAALLRRPPAHLVVGPLLSLLLRRRWRWARRALPGAPGRLRRPDRGAALGGGRLAWTRAPSPRAGRTSSATARAACPHDARHRVGHRGGDRAPGLRLGLPEDPRSTAFDAFGRSAVAIAWPGQTSEQAGGERAGRRVRLREGGPRRRPRRGHPGEERQPGDGAAGRDIAYGERHGQHRDPRRLPRVRRDPQRGPERRPVDQPRGLRGAPAGRLPRRAACARSSSPAAPRWARRSASRACGSPWSAPWTGSSR